MQKVFGAESMTKIEYRNLSYVRISFLVMTVSSSTIVSTKKTAPTVCCLKIYNKLPHITMKQRSIFIHFIFSEIIDSSIIEAIDNTMTYEENNPFPSPIQILSVNDYRRLIHSLYLKRPSPDAAFSLTSHFNARHYLQNRVIHISKPVGSSSTTRSIDYPLVNTSLGLIPLSYVQTPIETAELRCCGFVKVPLYELDSSIPIELHLPEPLHVQQWEQWPVPDDRERRRERKVREKMRKEEKEQPAKKMEEEMMEEKRIIETAGNDGNDENSAVTSREAMQKKQTGEEMRF